MLVTVEKNRRSQQHALVVAAIAVVLAGLGGVAWPPLWGGLVLVPLLYWLVRRRCLHRLAVMRQPFPAAWEEILQTHVRFFRALDEPQRQRFRQMVMVFLDEVAITGIR